MGWKKFSGPMILAFIAVLLVLTVNIVGNTKYEEGDTVDPDFFEFSCCLGLLSILSCLSSIVWLSFALGVRSEKAVFLPGEHDKPQHSSAHDASDSQSDALPSTIGGEPASYAQEKIAIGKSEGDTARMVGFLLIFGSIAMFGLMVLLGFISILMSLGPGLGFTGGTCNDTCESIWSGAGLSMWISISLFPCGLIALARPWSWFRSGEDIRNAAVGVTAAIAAITALIAVIFFGGPALIVLLIAGMAWSIYYRMEDVELRALKLDEVNELVWIISAPLILVAIVALAFEFGFSFIFGFFSLGGGVLIPIVVSVMLGGMVMILRGLNLVGTDGDWGALDLLKSLYSDFFDEEG